MQPDKYVQTRVFNLKKNHCYELYGHSGVGKTQLCLTLAAEVAQNDGGHVFYVDTKNDFSTSRLQQILTSKCLLNRICFSKCYDLNTLIKLFERILFEKVDSIGLMLIDNITHLVWRDMSLGSVNDLKTPLLQAKILFNTIKSKYNVPIILVNGVAGQDGTKPALGKLLDGIYDERIEITKSREILFKESGLSLKFVIRENGVFMSSDERLREIKEQHSAENKKQEVLNYVRMKMAEERKVVDLGLLDEDDEFEEYGNEQPSQENPVWEEDSSLCDTDFTVQLRSELENCGGSFGLPSEPSTSKTTNDDDDKVDEPLSNSILAQLDISFEDLKDENEELMEDSCGLSESVVEEITKIIKSKNWASDNEEGDIDSPMDEPMPSTSGSNAMAKDQMCLDDEEYRPADIDYLAIKQEIESGKIVDHVQVSWKLKIDKEKATKMLQMLQDDNTLKTNIMIQHLYYDENGDPQALTCLKGSAEEEEIKGKRIRRSEILAVGKGLYSKEDMLDQNMSYHFLASDEREEKAAKERGEEALPKGGGKKSAKKKMETGTIRKFIFKKPKKF